MSLTQKIATAFYGLVAALFLLSIGDASGLSAVRMYLGALIAAVAIGHLALMALRRTYSNHLPRVPPLMIWAAASLPTLWALGFFVEEAAQESSEAKGNLLYADLLDTVAEQGRCPAIFLTTVPKELPRTAFRNSRFLYQRSSDQDCGIGFRSASGFYCYRHLSADQWHCDD